MGSQKYKLQQQSSMNFVFAVLLAGSASAKVLDSLKAASPLTNCGCQCSPLTFRDSGGLVQGNCRSVDGTGAQWCYVDSHHSSCSDLSPSARFPQNPWSYEACATPTLEECAYLTNTAPHHPAPHHPEIPYNPYPEVPIDCRVPIAGCPGYLPPVNAGPTVVLGSPVAVGPTIANGGPSQLFPDNVRQSTSDGGAVTFEEPSK